MTESQQKPLGIALDHLVGKVLFLVLDILNHRDKTILIQSSPLDIRVDGMHGDAGQGCNVFEGEVQPVAPVGMATSQE